MRTLVTVETDIFDIANVLIPRVANDQLVLGDCDEASGERAASVVKQCADVGRAVIAYGPNLLTNGDFELTTGVGAATVPGPGWTTAYTVSAATTFYGVSTYQAYNAATAVAQGVPAALIPIRGKAIAVDVSNDNTRAIIQWNNIYLENGKTYQFSCSAGVINFPFGVSAAVDGVNVAPIKPPAAVNKWERTQANFVFNGASGYHTVGMQSNDPTAIGNDHVFDDFELRLSTSANTEARKPAAFEQIVGVVVDQIVETTNCNDDRRDLILAEIANNVQRLPVAATNIAVSATQIANTTFNLPANVRSFTVTAQAGTFNLSFNNGGAYTLTAREGSRTWGIANGVPIAGSDQIRIQSPNVGSLVDIIWEV